MVKATAVAEATARTVMAVLGGFFLTLFGARALANSLPLDGREAAIAASLIAWPIYIGVVIWCFAVGSMVRMVVPLAVLLLLLMALA